MSENIWSHFGVEPITDRDNVNIIGFDNGAGNCCACLGEITLNGFNAKHLCFDVGHNIDQLWTLFVVAEKDEVTVEYVGEEAFRAIGEPGTLLAVNFKRPLNDLSREQCETMEQFSYRQIMHRFFKGALLKVFQHNADQLKSKDRSVIFVGRPASRIWQKYDCDYQKLLCQEMECAIRQLNKGAYTNHKLDIVIYSEAQAALAYEYSQGNIKPAEKVLILDFGSSTFDAVLVHQRRIITEYSRQIGAGMVDENMADLLFAGGDEGKLKNIDLRRKLRKNAAGIFVGVASLPEVLGKCREEKERYYGSDGKKQQRGILYVQTNKGELKQIVDPDFMKKVIDKIPVRVQDSYEEGEALRPFQGYIDYPSFSAATDAFIKGVKKACKDKGMMPDRVILTGGASVMPFIREIICDEDNFGADILDAYSMNPAFSVGEGLAFMGFVESARYETFCKYETIISENVNNFGTAIHSAITSAYVDISWDSLIKDFEVWAVCDKYGNTLASGIQGAGLSIPVEEVSANLQGKLDEILKDISQGLSESFRELFGDNMEANYRYNINSADIKSIIMKEKKLQVATYSRRALLGFWNGIFIDLNAPLSLTERRRIVNRVKGRKQQVRDELSGQFNSKAFLVLDPIKNLLKQGMTEALESYLNECTPYFVEMAEK